MSADAWPIIQVLLGVIGTLSCGIAGLVWFRVRAIDKRVAEVEKLLPDCQKVHIQSTNTLQLQFQTGLVALREEFTTIKSSLALIEEKRSSDARIMQVTLENLRMSIQLGVVQDRLSTLEDV